MLLAAATLVHLAVIGGGFLYARWRTHKEVVEDGLRPESGTTYRRGAGLKFRKYNCWRISRNGLRRRKRGKEEAAQASGGKAGESASNGGKGRGVKTIGDGVVGLFNLGNTCYINSALQCLSHTPMLTEYFLTRIYVNDVNVENTFGFQELLACLLNGLHEDVNRITRKPYIEHPDSEGQPDAKLADVCWSNFLKREYSVVVALFDGQFKSTVVCRNCSYKSTRFEPFMFLQLPLPQDTAKLSLDKCLDAFTEEGDMEEVYCSRCEKLGNALKKMDMWRLPPILAIQLKRFRHTQYGSQKMYNNVHFPVNGLDLSPYLAEGPSCSLEAAEEIGANGGNGSTYDLYAVINHIGDLTGGHYVASVKSRAPAKWYTFNDSKVIEVGKDTVEAFSSSAYILLYMRRDCTGLSIEDIYPSDPLKTVEKAETFKLHRDT